MMLAELALQQQLLELYIVHASTCMQASILETRDCRLSLAQKQFSWSGLEVRGILTILTL